MYKIQCFEEYIYITKHYNRNISMHKFIELLNLDKLKTLKNLAIFIIKALSLRIQPQMSQHCIDVCSVWTVCKTHVFNGVRMLVWRLIVSEDASWSNCHNMIMCYVDSS